MINFSMSTRVANRITVLAGVAFLAATLVTPTTAASAAESPDCASGDAATAATTLFGPGTELVGTDDVAGVRSALALEPRIFPGTRRRMVAVGERWCEAALSFNAAWQAAGKSVGDGEALAQAYAQVAAAPYFDGVSVSGVSGVAGAWVVRTHARTNGIEARWVINTDADGIRSATWTATGFAAAPFESQWEGLTALPGAGETYTRTASGLVAERGLPTPEGAAAQSDEDGPGLLQHTFADGYTIVTSIGDTHIGVNPGFDTGVSQADKLRATMRAARENYEEFLSWGFTKDWIALPGHEQTFGDDVGFVYVNDALSAFCLACVFISDHFQIHLLSEVQVALDLLGYDGYRDRDQAYSLIIGHEMFHNFQNRYNKPGHLNSAGRGTPTSYSEGTARFQETLHDYAGTTFAPDTLVTAQNSNGCNGFDTGGSMDSGMAEGPFGKTYNTCFMWGPWYVTNGQDAFLDLIREAIPAHSENPNGFPDVAPAMEQAAGKPLATQLAEFAGAAITGRGRAWATWHGDEPLDWGSLFERWTPTVLARGSSSSRVLGAGGMMAHELTENVRVNLTGSFDSQLYLLRDDGTSVKQVAINGPSVQVVPKKGERVYALAVRPVTGGENVTLTAKPPSKPLKDAEPSGPAQPPIEATVVTAAPGAGERIAGLTSQFIEFEVPEGFDNATAAVEAAYPLPADIDLFLQGQNSDGTWSFDIASGTSGSLTGETMETGRVGPGRYRVEVHNWAGPAGNPVTVTITFYNSAGEPGA